MSIVTLKLKREPTVPLEAEVISPDRFAEMKHADIAAATLYHGKRQVRLDEFFEVDGELSDQLELHGDLSRVRHIGRAMTRGQITVQGDVGMHLGAHMKGGRIDVHGNAGDWLGGEMAGGTIHVRGRAGQQAGAAYRGSLQGMLGGTLIVDGNAGIEVGMRMRRGLISIGGRAGDFVGLQMKGGTILLHEGAEIRTGAWMQRGTIISLRSLQLMPTFVDSGSYNPTFIHVLNHHLKPLGLSLPNEASEGSYQRFSGDRAVPGKGEVLIWQS